MFRGSMVALITPMHEDGSPDWESLRALVDFHVEQGSDAIVAVGTTGEASTFDEDEHCLVIQRVVEYAAGRLPIIAGTGANSTTEALSLTQQAKRVGADACLLVTPYYNKPSQEGLYLHHKKVAESVDIPQLLYNVPGRTAVDMSPETIARLAQIDNIIGVKEATGELDRVTKLRQLCGPDFLIISGDDATSRELMLMGGNGTISVTANVAPKQLHEMCEAALSGDAAKAEALDAPLLGLHAKLFVEANPIPVKWAMHRMGMASTGIRLPLTWLSEALQPEVEAAMQQAGIL